MTTTAAKLEEAFKERIKKHYVAELLNISRPTLNTKIAHNDFDEAEVKLLISKNVISAD